METTPAEKQEGLFLGTTLAQDCGQRSREELAPDFVQGGHGPSLAWVILYLNRDTCGLPTRAARVPSVMLFARRKAVAHGAAPAGQKRKRKDPATGEIKRMWTVSSARRRGVARKVLHTLETIARESGLTTLHLETNRTLTEAQALYRKEGYLEVEPFNDEPYAHHWFAKYLLSD